MQIKMIKPHIKKIIVDQKPDKCEECSFYETYFDIEKEEYYYYCSLFGVKRTDSDTIILACKNIIEEQKK